jgi:hypothetical protein
MGIYEFREEACDILGRGGFSTVFMALPDR